MIYTSLELSKKLKENGCELESEQYWLRDNFTKEESPDNPYRMHKGKPNYACEFYAFNIANDILIRYAKEFFGEERKFYKEHDDSEYATNLEYSYKHCSRKILEMLQQGKDQAIIEAYIWNNTIFNNKNKGKDV